ncbi:MAG: FmdE family protein [Candidatus Freyarchaeota archaeon]
MNALGSGQSSDEELYMVVENDSCAVDDLQVVTGATFGKGNFSFRDYGKMAATFYLRDGKKAVRLVFKHESIRKIGSEDLVEAIREENPERKIVRFARRFGKLPDDEDFDISRVETVEPPLAEIRRSVRCENCGEMTMETKTVVKGGRRLCIPCVTDTSYYRVV